MRKFTFRFAAVEKVRKRAEDEALRALGVAQQKLAEARNHRKNLENTLNEALARRESLGVGAETTTTVFQLENNFILGTKQRIGQAEQAILRAQRGVEKALRNFLNARKQTRIIETLREKDFEEFKLNQRKREQREQDELYIMRAGVNANES